MSRTVGVCIEIDQETHGKLRDVVAHERLRTGRLVSQAELIREWIQTGVDFYLDDLRNKSRPKE